MEKSVSLDISEDNSRAGTDQIPGPAVGKTAWPQLPRSVVKSAGRALQILEYFDDVHHEAKMVEIARALHYPESSTSILLRSLVTLGYIDYDRSKRTYQPTSRVRLLGSWVDASLFKNDRVLKLMDELNTDTEDTIILASRNGLNVQYIHVVQAKTALRLHLTPGTMRPLTISAPGWVLLSHLPDFEIAKLIRRINADATEPETTMKVPELLRRVAAIRKDGHILTRSHITAGTSILAVPLPAAFTKSPLVLGIGSPTSRMESRADALIALLKRRIAEHFAN